MFNSGTAVAEILARVRSAYPGWKGLTDNRFAGDEIDFKREDCRKARTLLGPDEFRELLDAEKFDKIFERVRAIAKEPRLIYVSKMKSSDVSILNREDLDIPAFCQAFYDLIYGTGETVSRLERYLGFLMQNKLESKWSLPTFFLFLFFPKTEYLVRPRVVQWLLALMGNPLQYDSKPDAGWYGKFLKLLGEISEGLVGQNVECRDMVELQSLIGVAFREDKKGKKVPEVNVFPARLDEEQEEETDREEEYSLEEISALTGFSVERLRRWKRSILRKKQAVFYGPPGTGKTFIADHLARHLISAGRGFSQVVQFHPSYAYEDFIEGIRPSVNGSECLVYTKERGVFLEFCRKAAEAEGDPCVLIVDEINRAPLSRVFGELMYLLEYRKQKIRLASGREFQIPENVYLIGTMNTADRSIALVDHALRRRFAFISLFPDYSVLENFHKGTGFDASGLVKLLEEVNQEIGDRNYSVGVSFFLDKEIKKNIEDIWRMEIEPYLEEYFYDQNGKMEDFRWEKVRGKVLGANI